MTNSEYKVFIEKGNEYRIKTDLESNDLFREQYREALVQLRDIVDSQPIKDNEKDKLKKIDEQNNNIITFDGERGQGKSSAMRTFVNILKSRETPSQLFEDNNDVLERTTFKVLKTIDPSNFEKHNSVLNTVVANMYISIKNKWDNNQGHEEVEHYREIMTLFEKAYESLALINGQENSDKFDYDNGIEKIARVHQSDTLADTLNELIDKYLKIICNGNVKTARLVIPIDDLDTYIAKSYSLVDEIRKYLILPNVVIVLACKVEQLTRGAELHFQKELSVHKDDEQNSNNACRDMAIRYIDKVLPLSRRIILPNLASFERASVKLFYGEREKNSDKTPINELPEKQKSITATFLSLITKKTGIRYYENENNIHQIVPETLREIIDLTVLLVRMEDCADEFGNIIKQEIYKKNIKTFKEYFIFNFIGNNRDSFIKKFGSEIGKINPTSMNQRLTYKLLKYIEESTEFSIYGEGKNEIVSKLRDLIKDGQNNELWPLGDTVTMLNTLTDIYLDEVNQELQFILTSLLTFSAHELAILSYDKEKISKMRTHLFKFYNNSLFGERILEISTNKFELSKNVDTMINQEQSSPRHLSRSEFEINYAAVITELQKNERAKEFLEKEDELSQAQAVALLSTIIYHNGNYTNSLVAGNSTYVGLNSQTKTIVSLEAFFANCVDMVGIKTRFSGNDLSEFENTIDKVTRESKNSLLPKCLKQIILNSTFAHQIR